MMYIVLVLLVTAAVVFGNAILARVEILEAQVKRLDVQSRTVTVASTPSVKVSLEPDHPQVKPVRRSRKKAS